MFRSRSPRSAMSRTFSAMVIRSGAFATTALSSEEERGWERIVRPMAELSAGMEHDMAIGIADEIRRHLPVIGRSRDLTVAAAETGFADIVARVVTGTAPGEYRLSPEAVLYAKEVADQGHPIDVLLQTGHIGQFHIQRNWLGHVEAGSHDPELILGAVGYWQQFMFAWGEQLFGQWKQVYLAERSRSIDASDALRAAAVRQLLAGAPGYDVSRPETSAMNAAPCSCRTTTCVIFELSSSARPSARVSSPGSANT